MNNIIFFCKKFQDTTHPDPTPKIIAFFIQTIYYLVWKLGNLIDFYNILTNLLIMKIAIIGRNNLIFRQKPFLKQIMRFIYLMRVILKKESNEKRLSLFPQTKISPKYDEPLIKKRHITI